MTASPGQWAARAGLLFCVASAGAATDPVYITMGPNGKPMLSNESEHTDSRLMLAGHSQEVLAFRHRYRLSPASEGEVPRAERRPRQAAPEIVSLIETAASRAGLDMHLVKAVVLVESGFRPAVRSSAGAIGLMQVIPATGKRFGVTDLHDPALNLYAGTTYLAYLLKYFKGDVRLALAGYNAGEGAVVKHGYRIPPYAETQAYVPAVLSAWRSYRDGAMAPGDKSHLSKSPQ